jgi:hypothetical protein
MLATTSGSLLSKSASRAGRYVIGIGNLAMLLLRVRSAQANGRMFWFMRKKFFGSYFVLSSWRRR